MRKLIALLLILLAAMAVQGQTIPQSEPAPSGLRPRIGVRSDNPTRLTLQEAVTLALENNRDIEVERIGVQRRQFDLAAAKGVFDPRLESGFAYGRNQTPVASLLAGGENGKLETSSFSATTTLSQKLPWQGAAFTFNFENNRQTSQNLFQTLNPEYRTGFEFTYTQPLWRNRAIDGDRRQIRISSKQLALSDIQFRQRVIDIISRVNHAYWDLVYAYRNETIRREAVQLAETQLGQIQRMADKGTVAPTEMISARVEIERRTDEAEAALEDVQRAENNLKALLLEPSQTEAWNAMVLPVDQPQVDSPSLMSLDDALATAFGNRPEMEHYRVKSDLNQIDVAYYRNQTKPQVDFIAGYGAAGLAGEKRTTDDPLTVANQSLFTRVNQLSQLSGLPTLPATVNANVAPELVGGYGQSLANLFKNDYNRWQVGFNLNFSLGNHTAKARLGQALAEERQIDVERQRTRQAIEIEVRNALQSVETAYRRVEAASRSFANAGLQYEAEQRKFAAGLSTNYLILDRQNALSSAQGRKLKALTDYNKALTDLQRALSTTLSNRNIEVSSR